MRFEIGEGCVALRSLCAVRQFACVRWVLGRVAGSSFKGALHTLCTNPVDCLLDRSFLLSRVSK